MQSEGTKGLDNGRFDIQENSNRSMSIMLAQGFTLRFVLMITSHMKLFGTNQV